MKILAALVFAATLTAAQPSLNELQPRGAQKGRPFTLTVVGTGLGEGATIVSNLQASFTTMGVDKPGMENRRATFLVEPTGEWEVGIYTVRVINGKP